MTADNEELRGVPVDGFTIAAFAPRVWLAAGEYYWPSSTEFFLPNVHEENGHLVTNQPLGSRLPSEIECGRCFVTCRENCLGYSSNMT